MTIGTTSDKSYEEMVSQDVYDALRDDYSASDFEGMSEEEVREKLNNDLWIDDSVTGNGSGSYTGSRLNAKRAVLSDIEYAAEAYKAFGQAETFASDIISGDWGKIDVTARRYALNAAIESNMDYVRENLMTEKEMDE